MNILLKNFPSESSVLSGRSANLDITVREDRDDGATYELCKTVGSEGAMKTVYVECQQPLRGRFVRLKRLLSGLDRYKINVCEIQVYGYHYVGNVPFFQVIIVLHNNLIEHFCHASNDTLSISLFLLIISKPSFFNSIHISQYFPVQGCWDGPIDYSACPDGYFGVACVTSCNCIERCDDVNGACFGQVCAKGWQGSDCQTGRSFYKHGLTF